MKQHGRHDIAQLELQWPTRTLMLTRRFERLPFPRQMIDVLSQCEGIESVRASGACRGSASCARHKLENCSERSQALTILTRDGGFGPSRQVDVILFVSDLLHQLFLPGLSKYQFHEPGIGRSSTVQQRKAILFN
jgi:hypothetical protein